MKDTEQDFPVIMFAVLHMVVLNFESVDEALKRDRSNKSYPELFNTFLSCCLFSSI